MSPIPIRLKIAFNIHRVLLDDGSLRGVDGSHGVHGVRDDHGVRVMAHARFLLLELELLCGLGISLLCILGKVFRLEPANEHFR